MHEKKYKKQLKGWKKPLTKNDLQALEQGCYFSQEHYQDALDIVALCCFGEGENTGKPFEVLPWQQEQILKPLFGWRRANGTRRYTSLFCFVAKKNAKSTFCGLLTIVKFLVEYFPGQEVYCAATASKQARIAWKSAANIIKNSPYLAKHLRVLDGTARILYGGAESWIGIMANEANASEGAKAAMLVVDEIHAWSTTSDRKFFGSLRYSMRGKKNPLTAVITTAGDDLDSLGGSQYEYAKKVSADEIIDISTLSIIYEVPEEIDLDIEENYLNPEIWRMANPSMDILFDEEHFLEDLKKSRITPADWNDFMRYSFNRWCGADNAWLPVEEWKTLGENIKLSELQGMKVWGGLDLASKEDICSLAWVYMQEGQVKLITRHWVPQKKIEDEISQGRSKYSDMVSLGHLIAMPGAVIDQEIIFEQIYQDTRVLKCEGLAFDRWNSDQLALKLHSKGIEVVSFGQGYASFSEPSKAFKSEILDGSIRHDGNTCMNWMVSNCVVEEDSAGNVKPTKRKGKKRYKVDGVIATIMAYALASRIEPDFKSIYHDPEQAAIYV